jgi:methionyl-tRNA formyltransferase
VKKTPIGLEETTGDVHDRLAQLGGEGLLEALELLKEGGAPRLPQDSSKATYAPSIKREQCKIEWSGTSVEIVNQIRGLSPWPTAETQWNGMQLKIFSASVAYTPPVEGEPFGKVLTIEKKGIKVAASAGGVLIKELQAPSKKRMSGYDFTLGHPGFKPGEILS